MSLNGQQKSDNNDNNIIDKRQTADATNKWMNDESAAFVCVCVCNGSVIVVVVVVVVQ